MTYTLSPTANGTKALIDADVTLAGPAAQFGRTGLINEMSRRLIGDFAACLEAKMAAPTEAAARPRGDRVKADQPPLEQFTLIRRVFGRSKRVGIGDRRASLDRLSA